MPGTLSLILTFRLAYVLFFYLLMLHFDIHGSPLSLSSPRPPHTLPIFFFLNFPLGRFFFAEPLFFVFQFLRSPTPLMIFLLFPPSNLFSAPFN